MLLRILLLLAGCLLAPHVFAQPASVTFGSDLPRVGDSATQQVEIELLLKARVRRGTEVLNESDKNRKNAHTRRVTTTKVTQGLRTGVEVVYGEATDKPIAGKTYHCRREGKRLVITDASGAIPPLSEFEIVARHMQTLGKPNPLAGFLNERTVRIGESLDVPVEVAEQLFGSTRFRDTDRFQLKLTEIDSSGDAPRARFDAAVGVSAIDGTQMRMEVAGPMIIDAVSSSLVSANLLGPIAMNQARHDPGGVVQVSATGRLSVSLKSEKQRAGRTALRHIWRR